MGEALVAGSICKMKKNTHFVVQQQDFELLQGKENLTLYQFNTMTAKHYFCKTCGVQSFYVPRSNPDGYAVTFECIDPGTLTKVTIQDVDGNNWEKVFQEEGFVAPS